MGVTAIRFGRLSTVIAWTLMLGLIHRVEAATLSEHSSSNFALMVDDYLNRFGHYHPSIAAGNGLHDHDGELEDFSAASDCG